MEKEFIQFYRTTCFLKKNRYNTTPATLERQSNVV